VRILKKHRRKKILLIAHSMGSIIAYDVLTHVLPKSQIHTFVTIGSPLGMPIVISKIITEQKKKLIKSKKVRTPENVTHYWYNFSDLEDKTAIDYDLAGDYDENSKHIKVIDQLVHNNYEYDGKENPHKSFGYLRTPEFSKVIYDFLYEDKPWLVKWIRNKWDHYLSKFTGSGTGLGNIL
jgi:PGAP1-like protein